MFATAIFTAALSSKVFEQRECEHNTLSIKCPAGTTIKIKSASYGRTHGPEVCPHSATSNRNCHAATSVSIVKASCEGKQSCKVAAKNHIFGDPCGGTFKYLTASYECMAPEPIPTMGKSKVYEVLKCEHSTISMKCPVGSTIDVIRASYGRTHGPQTCPHPATSNRNCHASTSVAVVKRSCQGKNSCTVRASNNIFGDPCGGTYKYLSAAYRCMPTSRFDESDACHPMHCNDWTCADWCKCFESDQEEFGVYASFGCDDDGEECNCDKQGYTGCYDTRPRGRNKWRYVGRARNLDHAKTMCLGYNQLSLECPMKSRGDKPEVFCVEKPSEAALPAGECRGMLGDGGKHLNRGRNSHCNGKHVGSDGASYGGWHRGALYANDKTDAMERKNNYQGCFATQKRGRLGWKYVGRTYGSNALKNAKKKCKSRGYKYVSLECPTHGDNPEVFCVNNKAPASDSLKDEECRGMLFDKRRKMNRGRNAHCDGNHVGPNGISFGGWHRGALYKIE